MKTPAIYATSNYGSTDRYAAELAHRLETTVQPIDKLQISGPTIVMSYVHGPKLPVAEALNSIDAHTLQRFPVAGCVVGMSLKEAAEARDQLGHALGEKAEFVQRFYLPGELKYSTLSRQHKAIMWGIINALKTKPRPDANEQAMIAGYNRDISHVDFAELDPIIAWLQRESGAA